MEMTEIARQTIEFYKMTFENSYRDLMKIQEQADRWMKLQLDQTTGAPEEGKRALNEWIKAYKKACEEFRDEVGESFKRVESHFTDVAKPGKKK